MIPTHAARRRLFAAGPIKKYVAVAACVAIFGILMTSEVSALILGGEGNEPIRDPGWPAGAAAVFNTPHRVAWWEGPPLGGGQWHAECRGDATALNEVLKDFAAIESPRKRIVLHDGVGNSFWLNPNGQADRQEQARIDWVFVVWISDALRSRRGPSAGLREVQNPEDMIPRLDIYTGGNVRWSDVSVPEGVEVVDERLEAHGFQLEDGTVIEGTIIDVESREPLEATVRLERIESQDSGYRYEEVASASCDSEGHWVHRSVPSGWYRMVAEMEGYVPRVVGYTKTDGQPRWSAYSSSLARPAPIAGHVTTDDGQPLEGVEVRLDTVLVEGGGSYESSLGYSMTTDEQGRFHSDQVPRGRARIWVHKPGYCRPGLGLEVETPAEEISIKMVRAATLVVTVDFSATTRPDGYIVEIEDAAGAAVGRWGGSANLNQEGQVKFEQVPPGTYVLVGRPNPGSTDQETERVTVELEGGEAEQITLRAR